MAATRLIPMHMQKGKTIRQCLMERTDYAKNPEKTECGEYVSSFECFPETVDLDFVSTKSEYEINTGRKSGEKDVIAYQIRQAFKPGEITPEEANRIGYETAMRWTKGKHAFIVATHTDKAHIHNHIIYNSTTLDAGHKYKNFFFSSIALRRLSDTICLENGLSVIEAKRPSEWQKRTVYPKKRSVRDGIREAIDTCMEKNPKSMYELLLLLEEMGFETKRGKYVSVKKSDQKNFIRFRSLGEGYRDEELEKVFLGEKKYIPGIKNEMIAATDMKPGSESGQGMDMLLDIQDIIAKGKGPGYERWARIHNVKMIAQTLLFLEEKGIRSTSLLERKTEEATKRFAEISNRQKEIESRLSEIAELKKHIFNYSKTKEIYAEYKKHGYSKKFFEEHREEITLHKAAKEAFSKMEKPILKIKDLNEEYGKLLQEKKQNYAEYRKARKEMRDLQTAKYNVERFYQTTGDKEKEKGKKRSSTVL